MDKVPNYFDDVCPECSAGNPNGCRCLENHRTCRVCGTRWKWVAVIEYYHVENDYRTHRRVVGHRVAIESLGNIVK